MHDKHVLLYVAQRYACFKAYINQSKDIDEKISNEHYTTLKTALQHVLVLTPAPR